MQPAAFDEWIQIPRLKLALVWSVAWTRDGSEQECHA